MVIAGLEHNWSHIWSSLMYLFGGGANPNTSWVPSCLAILSKEPTRLIPLLGPRGSSLRDWPYEGDSRPLLRKEWLESRLYRDGSLISIRRGGTRCITPGRNPVRQEQPKAAPADGLPRETIDPHLHVTRLAPLIITCFPWSYWLGITTTTFSQSKVEL